MIPIALLRAQGAGRCTAEIDFSSGPCSDVGLSDSIFWYNDGVTPTEVEDVILNALKMSAQIGTFECATMLSLLLCHQSFPPCHTVNGIAVPQLMCESFCDGITVACYDIFEMARMSNMAELIFACDATIPVPALVAYDTRHWAPLEGKAGVIMPTAGGRRARRTDFKRGKR